MDYLSERIHGWLVYQGKTKITKVDTTTMWDGINNSMQYPMGQVGQSCEVNKAAKRGE